MKHTIKAYQGAAVVVQPSNETISVTVTHPGKYGPEERTAFMSDDAVEVMILALQLALDQRRNTNEKMAAYVAKYDAKANAPRSALA